MTVWAGNYGVGPGITVSGVSDGYAPAAVWIPAFAGMTGAAGMTMLGLAGGYARGCLDSRFRGNDGGG